MSEMNEIEAAAKAHKRGREAGDATQQRKENDAKDDSWPVSPLQIGLGVGSAALAAAALYMGTRRR